MSAVVDKLDREGFITRQQDPQDRRRWWLRANPAALARVEAIYAAHAKRAGNLLNGYSEEAFEVVLDFLQTFADELKNTAIELSERAPQVRVTKPQSP